LSEERKYTISIVKMACKEQE